jgi:hypothetical protein
LGSQLWGLDFHTRGFQDRNLKTFKTWFSGCGISILGPGFHTGGFTVAFGHGHPLVSINRGIRKVRTTQHHNPEFGHTQGEIKKNRQNKYISIQGGMKLKKLSILVVNWVSPCLSFFMSISTAVTCVFSVPNCTSTIINLELCAFNAEFQHFISRFNKMSWLCRYHWKTSNYTTIILQNLEEVFKYSVNNISLVEKLSFAICLIQLYMSYAIKK